MYVQLFNIIEVVVIYMEYIKLFWNLIIVYVILIVVKIQLQWVCCIEN